MTGLLNMHNPASSAILTRHQRPFQRNACSRKGVKSATRKKTKILGQSAKITDLKGEYIICKLKKMSLPSFHKITYFIGATYCSQESSEMILPDVL